MDILTYIEIPGHGYLRVPLDHINKLGIASLISGFSFRDSEYVYLECVEDMATYLDAIKKSFDELNIAVQQLEDFPDRPLDSFNPADPWLRVDGTPEGMRFGRELLLAELSGRRPVETKEGQKSLRLMRSLIANGHSNN